MSVTSIDELNEAINIIKNVCIANIGCEDCPMRPNCNEFPTRWEEIQEQ